MEGLARHERFDGHGAAVNLALFHGEIDRSSALIAKHDVKLGANRFFKEFGKIKSRAGGAAGPAFRRLAGFAHVFDGFVRAIGAHVEVVFALCRRADEAVFGPIVSRFFATDELVEVKRRRNPSERETVRLSHGVNIIRRNHGAGARHVLDDEVGIAGNILSHVLRDEPRP